MAFDHQSFLTAEPLFGRLRRLWEIGEREVISIFRRHLSFPSNLRLPIGDDASAVDLGSGIVGVLSTDMLVGKTDVPPGMTMWQAARKAVVMGVSDLAAKGARPLIALCSLGLPRDLTEGDITEVARGLDAGAREYGAHVVGGDTNESDDLVISCSFLGVCDGGGPVPRGGARPGDILAVTGLFGETAAGLKMLLEGLEAPPAIRDRLLRAVYEPRARLREGIALAQGKVVTSSIDSSDGLAWCLNELSAASRVGFTLTRVPVDEAAEGFAAIHNLDAMDLALYGGEEFELVVTIRPALWKRATEVIREVGGSLYRIGHATEEEHGIVLEKGGRERVIEPRGWEHFSR
ncbi:TPA: thiamine-phosphate kinase [Candidatus Bathyarchaeota archaeon]|nr:thiamine-phosphate kinase [Candidatus Bathyarchaeota archaeon]